MVFWEGRKSSENVVQDSQRTTFDQNYINNAIIDYLSDDGSPLKGGPIDTLDFSDIPNKTTIRLIDRMLTEPKFVDTRIREYRFDSSGQVYGVPTDFLLDSFKRAREVGLPIDWTSLRKSD